MRVFLALIGGFAVLVALLLGAWHRSARRAPAPVLTASPPDDSSDVVSRLPVEPARTRKPSAPGLRRQRAVIAEVAVLQGVVIDADGGGEVSGNLTVEADNGTDTFAARVTGQRFVLRLPSRVYSLTAHADGRIGRLQNVNAVPGGNSELVIRLESAATISGTVRGGRTDSSMKGLDVRALRAGSSFGESEAEVGDDGSFELEDLVPGARYDLVVGRSRRAVHVAGVLAPTTDVVVQFPEMAVLKGAVGGAAPGETCGLETVAMRGEDFEVEFPLDVSCHFQRDVPPGTDLLVTVTAPGLHYEANIAVPAEGEPDFLCLNPPCDQPATLASLDIRLEEHHCRPFDSIQILGDGNAGGSCVVEGGRCRIDRLPTGRPLEVGTSCPRCNPKASSVTLHPGENQLTLACQRERSIEGIVRRLGNGAPVPLMVRCPGGARTRVTDSFLFELHCLGAADEIEYRVDGDAGRWRRLAVPGTANPALVELTLP